MFYNITLTHTHTHSPTLKTHPHNLCVNSFLLVKENFKYCIQINVDNVLENGK